MAHLNKSNGNLKSDQNFKKRLAKLIEEEDAKKRKKCKTSITETIYSKKQHNSTKSNLLEKQTNQKEVGSKEQQKPQKQPKQSTKKGKTEQILQNKPTNIEVEKKQTAGLKTVTELKRSHCLVPIPKRLPAKKSKLEQNKNYRTYDETDHKKRKQHQIDISDESCDSSDDENEANINGYNEWQIQPNDGDECLLDGGDNVNGFCTDLKLNDEVNCEDSEFNSETDEDSEFNLETDEDSDYDEEQSDDYDDDDSYDSFDSYKSDDEDWDNIFDNYSEDNDSDYQLPADMPEDHRGVYIARDLRKEDNVLFENNNEVQAIELPMQTAVKVINQPQIILNHEYNEKLYATLKVQANESDASSDDCPMLVSSNTKSKSKFETEICCDTESDESESSMCSFDTYDTDDSSCGSEHSECSCDGQKYAHMLEGLQTEEKKRTSTKMEVYVVDARKCSYEPAVAVDSNDELAPVAGNQLIAAEKADVIAVPVVENFDDDSLNDKEQAEILDNELNKSNEEDIQTNGLTLETAQTDDELQMDSSQTIELQNFYYRSNKSNAVLVQLQTTLKIYGTVNMQLVLGAVEVFSYEPKLGEKLEIYSPRGCSTVCINHKEINEAAMQHMQINTALKQLKPLFDNAQLDTLKERYNAKTDALLLFENNFNSKQLINVFRKCMNENVFPNLATMSVNRALHSVECMLQCVLNRPSQDDELIVPTEWSTLQLQQQSRVLLAGGQNVGKSTLMRYLLNRHLRSRYDKILIIDLDIGQTELFVPETISCYVMQQPLLGAGFFYRLQPTKAFLLGNSSISLCMSSYAFAMQQLIAYCEEQHAHMPWLINTMGYNKGFAEQLMSLIINLIKPSDVVQLQSNKPINNFDCALTPANMLLTPKNFLNQQTIKLEVSDVQLNYNWHQWESAVKQDGRFAKKWMMAAKDLRHANILARLSDCLTPQADWFNEPEPIVTPLEKFKLFYQARLQTAEEFCQLALNNMVYLCRIDESSKHDLFECVGIGLVRSVNTKTKEILLLPAMPLSHLANVNCLCISEVPLPTALLLHQTAKTDLHAPFIIDSSQSNSTKAVKQIYFRSDKFLSGTHKELLQ